MPLQIITLGRTWLPLPLTVQCWLHLKGLLLDEVHLLDLLSIEKKRDKRLYVHVTADSSQHAGCADVGAVESRVQATGTDQSRDQELCQS